MLTHLAGAYGSEALAVLDLLAADATLAARLISDLPYLRAEVIHACRGEMALTPEDVLARRTSIILEDRWRGLGVLDEVTALMAGEYGWSEAQKRERAEMYRQKILSEPRGRVEP